MEIDKNELICVLFYDLTLTSNQKVHFPQFFWPSNSDQIWVPFDYIMCKISLPVSRLRDTQQFTLRKADVDLIKAKSQL